MQMQRQTFHAIQLPYKAICQYQAQISAYKCTFNIKNISNKTIYLNIISTFANFMEIQSFVTQLAASQTKVYTARIRPPNQIYRQCEFIGVGYSYHDKPEYYSYLNQEFQSKAIIKLQFNTQNNQDQQIDKILKQCSESELQQAYTFAKNNLIKKSIDKAEQAFILYRRNLKCLVLIAEGELKNNNLLKASRQIQLLLYYPQHQQYSKAVIIKLQSILAYISTIQFHGKLLLIKSAMKKLKKLNQNQIIDEELEKRSTTLMTKLQQIRHFLLSRDNGHLHQIIERAVQNYEHNSQIVKLFPKKDQFEQYLNKLSSKQIKKYEQTPQYALDPEIFMDPVITPGGMSYQKQFMINFFKKHGSQDPFTRTYIDPTLIVSNLTLKSLVRNNPNLHKWIKYEEQATKF